MVTTVCRVYRDWSPSYIPSSSYYWSTVAARLHDDNKPNIHYATYIYSEGYRRNVRHLAHCILHIAFYKGPVSGFVGHIPHPSLDSRISRNH